MSVCILLADFVSWSEKINQKFACMTVSFVKVAKIT